MSKQIVRDDDIYPDGVCVQFQWDVWEVGMSAFVPCIAINRAIKQMNDVAFYKNITMVHKVVIEGGVFGIRFWRRS